jgi:AGCS family alanine or glycine:cation symporter
MGSVDIWGYLERSSEYILFASCIFILAGSVFISFRTRFIQLRVFSELFQMIKHSIANRKDLEGTHTILPHRALFTAMSTTLGIGTIVGPIVAIRWGGPGALLGFLLTAFFGSAATYTEVDLSIRYRKKLPSGRIQGGPMEYLQIIFSPNAAKWYAVFGSLLMAAWSGAQANQLGAILNSPLLGAYRVPTILSGALLSIFVLFVLIGGTKRVSAFSAKIVPLMFILYLGSISWIILSNSPKFFEICGVILHSAVSPYAMTSGAITGGIVSAMRWGIFKGTQATEAGVGTQTIPHSMAETKDSHAQGMLAMISTYVSGIIAFLTGCVVLITGTWQDPNLPLGISMLAASFQIYFSYVGVTIVAISTVLFAIGTILGNSYNGSHCFSYLTKGKGVHYYYIAMALLVFVGTVAGVNNVWALIDLSLAFLVVPHMAGLLLSNKHRKTYENQNPSKNPL